MMKRNKLLKILISIIIIISLGLFINYRVDKTREQEEIESVIENDITNSIVEDLPAEIITGATYEDEEQLEVEGFLEESEDSLSGAVKDTQDDYIAGASQGTGSVVYYSQIDSRWKNLPYTSVGNSSQTIGSSGCGPSSAAMIVAGYADKNVTPKTLADLYVKNGFRTASNGTYTSAFKWTADRYGIPYKQVYNVSDAIQLVRDGYAVVCSCSNGLFTTGGHYIVLAGIDGNTLRVYDPYLYSGKFNSYGRSGKVTVSGNIVYCSVSNFKAYANTKFWFGYKKTSTPTPTPTPTPRETTYAQGQRVLVNDPAVVAYDGGAPDILLDNTLNQYWLNRSVYINGNVYGLATVVWDEGNRVLVQIFDTQFWVRGNSVSTNIPGSNTTKQETKPTNTFVLGKYVTNTALNVRKGAGTNYGIVKTYSKGTRFDTSNISGNWAKTPSGWVNLKYCTLVNKY